MIKNLINRFTCNESQLPFYYKKIRNTKIQA